LIDNSPDMRNITASIVDLAVRGYLKSEEREQTGVLAMLKGVDQWTELQSHERTLMSGLFDGGSTWTTWRTNSSCT